MICLLTHVSEGGVPSDIIKYSSDALSVLPYKYCSETPAGTGRSIFTTKLAQLQVMIAFVPNSMFICFSFAHAVSLKLLSCLEIDSFTALSFEKIT